MLLQYKTVKSNSAAQITEKKSVFICNIRPIQNEDEANGFINEMKSKYWDASHNVYAYKVGTETIIERYSDDGEPSGTAGIPMLQIIKSNNLENTAAVVTRYFGGTLLGTGGLVRSYSSAVQKALEDNQIIEMKLCDQIELEFDYTFTSRIQSYISNNKYKINNNKFAESVKMEVMIPVNDTDNAINALNQITCGKISYNYQTQQYTQF